MSTLAAPARADVPLVQDGVAIAKIYLPAAGDSSEKSHLAIAAQELNYHLQKMSGATLEVVRTGDAQAIQGPAIILGELALQLGAQPQKRTEAGEGFRLLARGDTLLIGGESDQAVLFGVYEVLERLGCDWLMPGAIGEVIPARKTVVLSHFDESQAPDFPIRILWYSGGQSYNGAQSLADFEVWNRRQKKGDYNPAPLQTSGHAWEAFVPKHKAEFDKDPTMYALVRDENGELVRRGLQIESTHPRVIELFVQDIKEAFANNNWPKDKAVGFPIGPADTSGYSISPEALLAGSGKIDPITGNLDRTDELILLANRIHERIEKEYPNVWLGFYSYAEHGGYPYRYHPHPRIAQIFAPINYSRFHSLLDDNSKTQPHYRKVVEKWVQLSRKQGNALIYRGYNWNLADNMLPYSKLRIWGEELPYYKKNGFMGLSVETARSWSITGPGDWLFMKLAWNTGQDWKMLLREYCVKAFGAGAGPMEEYYRDLTNRQHEAGQEAGSYHAFHLIYDKEFIRESERKFERAAHLAQTPLHKARVAHAATPVETLKLYFRYRDAASRFEFADVKKAYDTLWQQHEKISAMNGDLVSPFTPLYLKRFLLEFAEQGMQYSTGIYRIAHRLPDELPAVFDPQNSGTEQEYFSPALNDKGWAKTKTYSSTWDAQGLASLRGSVWYRHRFQLSPESRNQPLGLFLGGFDDEARVWLNGEYIGSSGQGFGKPAVYDLTDALRRDGENVLVIQIEKHTVNEIGTGGIIRPSFLFSGPRLKQKAPEVPAPVMVRPGAGDVTQ